MDYLKRLFNVLRDDRTLQNTFLILAGLFLLWFVVAEWDGLIDFATFLVDAGQSTPGFAEGVVDYFDDVASERLRSSLLVGGIFGAAISAVFLSWNRGWLYLPPITTDALLTGLLVGVLAYYTDPQVLTVLLGAGMTLILAAYFYQELDGFVVLGRALRGVNAPRNSLQWLSLIPRAVWIGLGAAFVLAMVPAGFWNALGAVVGFTLFTALIYEPAMRAFFTPGTLRKLANQRALITLAIGAGVGLVGGAIGGQILMYPLQHCTYDSEVSQVQYRMGLALTAFSTLILLIPAWTLLSRQRRSSDGDTIGYFRNRVLPYFLLLPSLIFLLVFLYYPAIQIMTQSTRLIRRNSDRQIDYCLQHYVDLSESVSYQRSFSTTIWTTAAIVAITMILALLIAILASQRVRGANVYRTLLIWPYAISPLVIGAIFLNMFRQGGSGIINWALDGLFGIQPAWLTDPNLAPWVIVSAAVWNALGFNVLFYIAGLQNIPKDLLEAAAIDGANLVQRFFRVTLPLLSPFTFFLLIANVTYSFYGIYPVVDVLTEGGPPLGPAGIEGGATNVLIYDAYRGAFDASARVGEASARAVILFILVAAITLLQFRYVERRVTYGG